MQIWNLAAMIVFVLLGALSLWLIDRYGKIKPLEAPDICILALATFRLSHLFTNDKIFDFVRVIVFDRKGQRLAKSEIGWRRILCEVMECLWCAGLWSALIVCVAYQLGHVGVSAVILLAIAGAAALLSIIAKTIANYS